MINYSEKSLILSKVGDELWEDFINNFIPEEIYLLKMRKLKHEIDNNFLLSMKDVENFVSSLGYIVVKMPNYKFESEIMIKRNFN